MAPPLRIRTGHHPLRTSGLVLCGLLIALALAGCASPFAIPDPDTRRAAAGQIAAAAGFVPRDFPTPQFRLVGFTRIRQPGAPVSIYIEGDGFAYITPHRPSRNPTPRRPMGLLLATLDPAANVVYMGRPCQYVEPAKSSRCHPRYWTTARFAEPVIAAHAHAVGDALAAAGSDAANLVGYSGGGAVAALVAARRGDIASLRTLAGYLEHVRLNREKRVSPLAGSLDPIRVAATLSRLPQIHYSGIRDAVIPPRVAQQFVAAVGNEDCAHQVPVDADHRDGWLRFWRHAAARLPVCDAASNPASNPAAAVPQP